MPHRGIDNQIDALEKRMRELAQESARLEAELEKLRAAKVSLGIGVIDDTRIIAGADVPQGEKPN